MQLKYFSKHDFSAVHKLHPHKHRRHPTINYRTFTWVKFKAKRGTKTQKYRKINTKTKDNKKEILKKAGKRSAILWTLHSQRYPDIYTFTATKYLYIDSVHLRSTYFQDHSSIGCLRRRLAFNQPHNNLNKHLVTHSQMPQRCGILGIYFNKTVNGCNADTLHLCKLF